MEKVKHILLSSFGRYGGKVVVLCIPLGDTSVFLISEVDNLLLRLVSADRLPTETVDLLPTDRDQGMSLFPKYNYGSFHLNQHLFSYNLFSTGREGSTDALGNSASKLFAAQDGTQEDLRNVSINDVTSEEFSGPFDSV
jgi:hypothetical protein